MSEPRFSNGEFEVAYSTIEPCIITLNQDAVILRTLKLLDKTLEQAREASANCIPRSSLPELPSGWYPPFKPDAIYTGFVSDAYGNIIVSDLTSQQATFLAALLNAVYGKGE